jgi:hypothetical protein
MNVIYNDNSLNSTLYNNLSLLKSYDKNLHNIISFEVFNKEKAILKNEKYFNIMLSKIDYFFKNILILCLLKAMIDLINTLTIGGYNILLKQGNFYFLLIKRFILFLIVHTFLFLSFFIFIPSFLFYFFPPKIIFIIAIFNYIITFFINLVFDYFITNFFSFTPTLNELSNGLFYEYNQSKDFQKSQKFYLENFNLNITTLYIQNPIFFKGIRNFWIEFIIKNTPFNKFIILFSKRASVLFKLFVFIAQLSLMFIYFLYWIECLKFLTTYYYSSVNFHTNTSNIINEITKILTNQPKLNI